MFFVQPASYASPPLDGASDDERAIVSTLLYYDLFSFPIGAAELLRFAHRAGLSAPRLAPESAWWSSQRGYWFLRGREALVARRESLAQTSQAKLGLVLRWAWGLQCVPGVRFVGVTGSLAMQGATAEDDIDLLVIAAAGRLWLTRALVLAWLWLMGAKRSDNGGADHPDQACANVFLSEDGLALPDHNLFIAHELCQMLPLVGPDAYARLLNANPWIHAYLPQWTPDNPRWQDRRTLRYLQRSIEILLWPVHGWLERQAARWQQERIRGKHARGHNPHVRISANQLRFNPHDHTQDVISAFLARWRVLNAESRYESMSVDANRVGQAR